MAEEVEDKKISQSENIISKIKGTSPFGPFGKCEPFKAKQWVQWQCFKVCNINFHYEIIAGARSAVKEGEKKDTSKIYAEFHMEPLPEASDEMITEIKKNIETIVKDQEITSFDWYTGKKGLAIRYKDGVEITAEKIIDQLADQMTKLYTQIDNIVYSFIMKYTFKGLFDSSDTSAEKFLIDFNKRICDFYNKNGMEMASYLLIKILEQVNKEYFNKNGRGWRLPFGEDSAKRIFGKDDVKDLFSKNSKKTDTILIKNFIERIKSENFLISPFSFWSIFFSHNNAFVNSQRPSVLSSLLNALGGDESNRENIVTSLIDLRNKKARQLSKQKKGKEENNLTIEGWTQLVDKLSDYAPICWKLFEEVMSDNPNKDTINGYIQNSETNKKNKKNGENGIRDCKDVGPEAVPNILPFIRPDLKFDFDNNGNIMSITKTEEVNMEETIELLKKSYQIILTGAPGTGKTWLATKIAEEMIKDARTDEEIAKITEEAKQTEKYKKAGTDEEKAKIAEADKEKLTEEEKKRFQKVQFHPGYDYSDFIIGLKPKVTESGDLTFEWENGIFKNFVEDALKERECAKQENRLAKPYIFIIDEINRADLSRVFGEVFSLLEEDYRYPNKEKGITLPNDKNFILPDNLYIIGTMNDIDRSVESMDFALRRRFSWKEVTAEESTHIIDAKDKKDKEKIEKPEHRDALKRAMNELNIYIGGEEEAKKKEKLKINGQDVSLNLGKEYQLGGAYFLNFAKYQDDKSKDQSAAFESLWNNHIAIILNEYLRGRSNRQAIILALKKVYDNALKVNAENAKPADDKKETTPSSASETQPAEDNQ